MAEQKKVELILGIKTTGAVDAAAGLDSISKVATSLAGELSKLERADVLKQLGATAAQVGADIGSVDMAAERLAAELKAIGATEAEIRKVSAAFDTTTASIQRTQEKAEAAAAKQAAAAQRSAEATAAAQAKLVQQQEKATIAQGKAAEKDEAALRAQTRLTEQMRLSQSGATGLQKELSKLSRESEFQKLAVEAGLAAKKTGDVGKSVADLTKKLEALGATKGEIAGVASAFNAAQNGEIGGGGSGPGGNLLQRLGAQGRNLPSVQIPGAGIGTDAISNLTRLTGALGEAAGATAAMTTVTAALTPVLGATGAAVAGVVAVAGPVIAVAAVLALAIKSIGDQAAIEAKAINAIVDAQRKVGQDVAEGLTSDEATKRLETLNAQRKVESDLLFKNQQVYDENINSAGALTGVLKLTSGAEEALAGQIDKSKESVTAIDTEIAALEQAAKNGALAANDAAEAEKKLADERSKAALSTADAAGKELQFQQKALASTEEQNNARLTAIDNEKAVVQEQIDTLTASGVTSEEVTAKIKSLTEQLGLLGKESSFIKDEALAVAKQNDADKKAKKDAEDAAKKAEQAQEQYTKAVQNAAQSYKQSLQDIGTRLTQALSDNTTKFSRDLLSLDTKFNRDTKDIDLKAKRAERDALIDQQEDLKDIRRDAAKSEAEALRDGDFKNLYLSRIARDEAIAEQEEGLESARQKRDQSNRDAQEDLVRNAQRQRQDRLLGYQQQGADLRTNNQRELAQARLTQERALQAAAQAQNAGLGQIQNYWNKFLGIQQQGMNNSLKMAAGQTGEAGTPRRPGAFTGSFTANGIGSIIRK